MGKHEFKFVVSDVELTEEQQARVSHAVGQAGALALGDLTPPGAVSVALGSHVWWRGLPPDALRTELERFAQLQIG
ncbi:hypothetical protein [Kitasatospora sp. NPDC057223]|jgi:hypothetical protein|uniref:hypothetical protein n=1 Tax=Kitasatospora sp. NPDC057223 TaxID=3346055 RepID=UPI0036387C9E